MNLISKFLPCVVNIVILHAKKYLTSSPKQEL